MTPPQDTPTPRTDEQDSKTFYSYHTHYDKMTELARSLERELAEAKVQFNLDVQEIRRQHLQELNERKSDEELIVERDAYKAAAERLAVACERHGGLKGERFCSECREALAEFDKPELTAFVTPAQRIWLERAVDFSLANDEVEDWSFLNAFVPEPGNTQIEQGESEEAT